MALIKGFTWGERGEREGGGNRVQRISIQSRFFLSDSSEEDLPVRDNVEMVCEILFLFGETQNERANARRSPPSSRADGGSSAGVLLVLSELSGPG